MNTKYKLYMNSSYKQKQYWITERIISEVRDTISGDIETGQSKFESKCCNCIAQCSNLQQQENPNKWQKGQ